jgi:hypothetical protein
MAVVQEPSSLLHISRDLLVQNQCPGDLAAACISDKPGVFQLLLCVLGSDEGV